MVRTTASGNVHSNLEKRASIAAAVAGVSDAQQARAYIVTPDVQTLISG